MPRARIIGLDPGTQWVGYAVLECRDGTERVLAHGVLRGGQGPIEQRLLRISFALSKLMRTFRPDQMALEEAFFGRNVRSALRMGEGRGAILLTAARHRVTVFQYSPAEVKKSVVGFGNAHKTQVARMVSRLVELAEAPETSDAADALALALCHARRVRSGACNISL